MSTVTKYLAEHDLGFVPLEHPRAFTSIEEARALGIKADEVAKTIVLDTDKGHAIAVIPASRRLDSKRVREAVGPHTRMATEGEIAKDFPGYQLGAIPPIGAMLGVPMYVDPELARHETIVFAAGVQTESVQMHTADLLADPNTSVVPLTRVAEDLDRDWME